METVVKLRWVISNGTVSFPYSSFHLYGFRKLEVGATLFYMLMEESNHLSDITDVDVLIIDAEVDLCLFMKAYLLRKGC